jgi:hypothetical protein
VENTEESWRPLPFDGFPKYAVSSFGRIKHIPSGYVLRPPLNKGCRQVSLYCWDTARQRTFQVRTLVALAFIGPRPDRHILRNKPGRTGDAADNLEYVPATSPKEKARGEANGMAKLTDEAVMAIRRDRANGASYAVLARKYKVCRTTVYEVCRFGMWQHVS